MRKIIPLLLILSLLLCGCLPAVPAPTTEATSQTASTDETLPDSGLMVHYIDVGQADCALIEYEGCFILIDGGNVDDSSLVVSYLEQQGVTYLNLVVCTHAHEDHVGGLSGVLAVYETGRIWSPTRTYSSSCFDKFVYYADQQGQEIYIPSPGDTFTIGDKVTLTVLGPTQSYAETNNTSIVIMLEYGDTRFLFTGDMEKDAETDMLDYWGEDFDWNCDVLKVGHHGSTTSSSYRFVYQTDPEYAVIPVGKDNSYGHPHDEIVALYQDAGIPMFRTDELGHIIASSDGKTITITWDNQSAQPEDVEQAALTYIGNKNSKKLHLSTCSGLPKAENQVIFESYDDAIAEGYTPCSNCMG